MAAGESTPQAGLRFEQLTGLELRMVKRELGRPLHELARDGDLEVAYVMEWLRRRREDSGVELEEVLELPLEEVLQHLDSVSEEDPTSARSGEA